MFNYFISHTYMNARNHCFSLFRMKTVADLRMLMNGYKKDVSEDGSLLAPDVTNGLVLYINSNLKIAKPACRNSEDSGKTSTKTRCEH